MVGEKYQLSGVTTYFTVFLHRHNMRLTKVMYQLLGDTGLQLASGLILEWLFGSLLCCHLSWWDWSQGLPLEWCYHSNPCSYRSRIGYNLHEIIVYEQHSRVVNAFMWTFTSQVRTMDPITCPVFAIFPHTHISVTEQVSFLQHISLVPRPVWKIRGLGMRLAVHIPGHSPIGLVLRLDTYWSVY